MATRYHETKRPLLGIRLSEEAIAIIDRMAADASTEDDTVTRSEQARRMLAFAAKKMPKGWTPKVGEPSEFL